MDSPKNGIRDGMFIKNFKTNDSRRNSLNSFSKINRESPKIRKLSVSYSIKKVSFSF